MRRRISGLHGDGSILHPLRLEVLITRVKGEHGSAEISMWNLFEIDITLLVSNNGSGFSVELVPSINLASNSVGDRFFSKRGEPNRQEKGHVVTD